MEPAHPPVRGRTRLSCRGRGAAAEPPRRTADDREWSEPLLRQNAIWFCQLRWIVVAVLAAVGVAGVVSRAGSAPAGLGFPPAWPLGAAARPGRPEPRLRPAGPAHALKPATAVPVRLLLWAQIVTDLLVLTAVIHWLGSDLAGRAVHVSVPHHPGLHRLHAGGEPGRGRAGGRLLPGPAVARSRGGLDCRGVRAGARPASGVRGGSASRRRWPGSALPMLLIWAVIWYLVSRLARALRSRDRELAVSNRRLARQHRGAVPPHAPDHAPVEGAVRGDPCPDPVAAGRLLRRAARRGARPWSEKISAAAWCSSRQIQEMLQLANLRSQGQTPPPRREVNLDRLIEETHRPRRTGRAQRGIRFERQIEPVRVAGRRRSSDHAAWTTWW